MKKTARTKHNMSDGGMIDVAGRAVPLTFRHNRNARRIILRADPDTGGAIVTLPPGVAAQSGRRFAEERADWIAKCLATAPDHIEFTDGAVIPLLGIDHVICHTPERRGAVVREDGRLLVSGHIEHLSRRLRDWLKAEARRHIGDLVAQKASEIGRPYGRITIRDTRSRWGSCSSTGGLNFSWRLIMAPQEVLEYVVCHEVAHLAEHNHGPRFWAVTQSLCEHMDTSRKWLSKYGQRLHHLG